MTTCKSRLICAPSRVRPVTSYTILLGCIAASQTNVSATTATAVTRRAVAFSGIGIVCRPNLRAIAILCARLTHAKRLHATRLQKHDAQDGADQPHVRRGLHLPAEQPCGLDLLSRAPAGMVVNDIPQIFFFF